MKSWAPSTDRGIGPTGDDLDPNACDVLTLRPFARPSRQSATRRECLKLIFSSWSLSTSCQIRHSHNAHVPPITHHANVNGGGGERTRITIVPFPQRYHPNDGPSSSGPACWGRCVLAIRIQVKESHQSPPLLNAKGFAQPKGKHSRQPELGYPSRPRSRASFPMIEAHVQRA